MATVQGWGRQTWNSGAWNTFAPVAATGNGLTSSLGSSTLTGDCNITLTGIGTTLTTGTAVATGVAVAIATGNAITSTLGTETVTGSSAHTLTGIGVQAQIGDETATGVAQSGWNRGANADTGEEIGWNDNLWNILESSYSLTGNQLSLGLGSVSVSASVDPSITVGVGLTSSTGVIGGFAQLVGNQVASSIGTFSITGDSQLTVVAASEPELDINIGTAAVEIGKTAFPPGNAMTSSLGSLTVTGTSVVSPSGVNLTGTLGTEVASTNVNVIGTGGFVTKTVTVVSTSSGNKYVIDGVQQETLELVEGVTYRFDQADSSNSGHPFRFSETSNGTHAGGSEYTTGVTTNGTPGNTGAYTQITVASSAPTLYYYCTQHSAMGGQANTPTASAGTNIFTASGLTVSLGQASETVTAGATVAATGNALTASLGDETQETSYALTGVTATSNSGTLTVTASSTLTLTGVSVTSSTGTLQGTFWSEVDDSNSDISWTEVHQAA